MSLTKMYKLRTKPVEAVYLTEDNIDEVIEWCDGDPLHFPSGRRAVIGENVLPGEHVIFMSALGYFVVLTVDRFEELWEPVEESEEKIAFDARIQSDDGFFQEDISPLAERPLDTVVDN